MKHIGLIKILLNTILVVSVLSLYGQRDSTKLKRFSERRLTKKIVSQYCDYKNLSYKIDAKITTSKKTYNLNILYRNVRDSVIWINVNHNTGVPVARFLLTQDSLKMLNRMDNKYLAMANAQIVKKFNYDVTAEMIQAIFVGELLNLDSDKELLQSYSHYKVYKDSASYILQNIKKKKINRLVRKDKIDEYYIHQNNISPKFKILSMSLDNNMKQQKILVDYLEYEEEIQCPKKIDLILSNREGKTEIKMKIKKIKLNKDKLGMSFKVPKKYEQIIFE